MSELQIRGFRCFERARLELGPGATCIVGPNAQGKTSLLEAACVLLRLQSPRASTLGQTVRFGDEGFALEGKWNDARCQYFYSAKRRRLVLDAVEQRRANEYLQLARVVWFGNDDLDLIRGGGEERRRFLDFAIAQTQPSHRSHLRSYEKALRSRNMLLKTGGSAGEIAAYSGPLLKAGEAIRLARRAFIEALAPVVAAANREIGGEGPLLDAAYKDGVGAVDFAEALARSSSQENRLRQTVVGPHRDDLELTFEGRAAAHFASEGQQRTAALALRLGQAEILHAGQPQPPLFLIDDIFGELDPVRRNRLLQRLPKDGQQLITTTHLEWVEAFSVKTIEISQVR
ncbi:MAG TPA: DNA replication and repair protein RecF [Chthoniobacterales bacterium]